ncbi:hypothetical protein [Corynebacterium urealyticum]|uniref:Uncharacterized protein n=1 Tax=Corynebacterium urealyticum TaxID=43771 RepID=A0A5D4G2Y5_9CORY|nr:hypothetical protein [Corynebacterium urealyticum]TYR20920.1 hypothetical protein FYJ87_08460 [Corynebacterium urealyticum]
MNAGPGNTGDSFRRRDPERGQRPPRDAQPPLPPEVYRRRRIAAIAAVVVVILLLWWLLSSLGGSQEDASTPAADTTQSSSAAPTSGKEKKPDAKDKKAESEKQAAKKSEDKKDAEPKDPAAEKTSCELADLRVTAVPGKSTFDPGEEPTFYAKIANPTKADCVIDVDEAKLLFEVFAMDDYHRVWGDLDCNEPSITGEVTIEAGESQNYKMGSWSRTTSAPDQCDARQPVGPGSYLLYAHLGDNVSQPATFNMS